jgi:hypothetical protein
MGEKGCNVIEGYGGRDVVHPCEEVGNSPEAVVTDVTVGVSVVGALA